MIMELKNNNLTFWIIFLSSLACYVGSAWCRVFDIYFSSCSYSAIFFGVTWLWLRQLKGSGMNEWMIAGSIFLGTIVLELPLFVFEFSSTYMSFMCTVCRTAAIAFAVICFREQNIKVNILVLIIMLLMNSVLLYLWHKTSLYVHR